MLRADGVAEKAICRAYAARRDAKVVLERTKAVAGAAVVLELFRGGSSAEADAGAWDVVHSGPGGGCRAAFAVAERDATPLGAAGSRRRARSRAGGATVDAAPAPTTAPPAPPPPRTALRSVGGGAWRVAWSDDKQRPYYDNVTSGLSQWTPPLRAWE
ncbi:3-oxo-behenoyl-CoA reductase [Aureococcus anophagefferens]|nr:3-oxo-behenoyl-CoA reductase [Aureococcus anophagefferens]